jgi:hypothetical protein
MLNIFSKVFQIQSENRLDNGVVSINLSRTCFTGIGHVLEYIDQVFENWIFKNCFLKIYRSQTHYIYLYVTMSKPYDAFLYHYLHTASHNENPGYINMT